MQRDVFTHWGTQNISKTDRHTIKESVENVLRIFQRLFTCEVKLTGGPGSALLAVAAAILTFYETLFTAEVSNLLNNTSKKSINLYLILVFFKYIPPTNFSFFNTKDLFNN